MAASGVIGSCPSPRNSSGFIFSGSRAMGRQSDLIPVPIAISGGVVISLGER
jgi:hypothetical protein